MGDDDAADVHDIGREQFDDVPSQDDEEIEERLDDDGADGE